MERSDLIASYFSDPDYVVNDSMSLQTLTKVQANPADTTVVQRSGGAWSIIDQASVDNINLWMAANNLGAFSNDSLQEFFPSENVSPQIYINAGELVKIFTALACKYVNEPGEGFEMRCMVTAEASSLEVRPTFPTREASAKTCNKAKYSAGPFAIATKANSYMSAYVCMDDGSRHLVANANANKGSPIQIIRSYIDGFNWLYNIIWTRILGSNTTITTASFTSNAKPSYVEVRDAYSIASGNHYQIEIPVLTLDSSDFITNPGDKGALSLTKNGMTVTTTRSGTSPSSSDYTGSVVDQVVSTQYTASPKPLFTGAMTQTVPTKIDLSVPGNYIMLECNNVEYDITLNLNVLQGTILETRQASLDIKTLLAQLIDDYDRFSVANIVEAGVTDDLKQLISNRVAPFDSFMSAYADYTSMLVIDSVITAMYQGAKNGVYTPVYGVQPETVIYGSSIAQMVDDPYDIAWVGLADLKLRVEYNIELFETLHSAVGIDDYGLTIQTSVNDKISAVINKATQLMVSFSGGSETKKALLYGSLEQESTLSKVLQAVELSIMNGASSMSDTLTILSMVSPEMSFGFHTSETKEAALAIIAASAYDGYVNCISNQVGQVKDVSYISTYTSRSGSSLTGMGGVEPEFTTLSDGALILSPALYAFTVNIGDLGLPAECFYIPLKNSIAMFCRSPSSESYQVAWYARFRGGNDYDLAKSIADSSNEFYEFVHELAICYTGADATFTYPVMTVDEALKHNGFAATIANVVGIATNTALAAVVGFLYAGPVGAAVGGGAAALLSVFTSGNADGNTNLNYSAMQLLNKTVFDDIDNPVYVIDGFGALDASGKDAFTVSGALMAWAVKYGMYAPIVPPEGVTSPAYGVGSNSAITAKYIYRGESEDYGPLALNLMTVLTVGYMKHYLGFQKTRNAIFIPGAVAGASVAAVTAPIKAILNKDDGNSVQEILDSVESEQQATNDALGTIIDMVGQLPGSTVDAINQGRDTISW